jgi:hypothetical protein
MASITTTATTVGAPRRGPPSTIPRSAPSRYGQGCILRSSSRRVHHSMPCLLHQCTTGQQWPLLRALVGASTALAAGHGPCLVALDGRVRSTVINQLLQHHGLDSQAVTGWVADSGASNHTTLDVGNLTSIHPPSSTNPSPIIVGNGLALLITSVGDSVLPGLF